MLRVATDTLARRLRNLASPSNGVTAGDQQPLELASAQDLIPPHPTLGDVDSPQALLDYQAAKRVHKAEWMAGTAAP